MAVLHTSFSRVKQFCLFTFHQAYHIKVYFNVFFRQTMVSRIMRVWDFNLVEVFDSSVGNNLNISYLLWDHLRFDRKRKFKFPNKIHCIFFLFEDRKSSKEFLFFFIYIVSRFSLIHPNISVINIAIFLKFSWWL